MIERIVIPPLSVYLTEECFECGASNIWKPPTGIRGQVLYHRTNLLCIPDYDRRAVGYVYGEPQLPTLSLVPVYAGGVDYLRLQVERFVEGRFAADLEPR